MRTVTQRVLSTVLRIDGEVYSEIGKGLLILAGFEDADGPEDIKWMAAKLAQLRIFSDADGHMNLSVQDVEGDIMVVSQFTLHALTKKGNRPSFINAAKPDKAIPLYESLIEELNKITGKKIKTGKFGADMKILLENDGPVTIIIDSKQRE